MKRREGKGYLALKREEAEKNGRRWIEEAWRAARTEGKKKREKVKRPGKMQWKAREIRK